MSLMAVMVSSVFWHWKGGHVCRSKEPLMVKTDTLVFFPSYAFLRPLSSRTALMMAVLSNDTTTLETLVGESEELDTSAIDNNGYSAIHHAVVQGNNTVRGMSSGSPGGLPPHLCHGSCRQLTIVHSPFSHARPWKSCGSMHRLTFPSRTSMDGPQPIWPRFMAVT